MPTTFTSTPLDAARIALVPPKALHTSKLPEASASVCLAPELISGKVTVILSLPNSFTRVWLFLSTILGIFKGDLTYVTFKSFTGGAAASFFSPAQPVSRVNAVKTLKPKAMSFLFISYELLSYLQPQLFLTVVITVLAIFFAAAIENRCLLPAAVWAAKQAHHF